MPDELKGRISEEQTVWCWTGLNSSLPHAVILRNVLRARGVHCHGHHQGSKPIMREICKQGWVATRKFGWMCSRCHAALTHAGPLP